MITTQEKIERIQELKQDVLAVQKGILEILIHEAADEGDYSTRLNHALLELKISCDNMQKAITYYQTLIENENNG